MNDKRPPIVLLSGAVLAVLLSTPRSQCWADLQISQVAPGVYGGRAPTTADDYQLLKRYGIKTVVDMRKFKPRAIRIEQQRLAAMGIQFRNVPVGFFPRRDGSIEPAVALLSDPRLQPIYIHCNLGRDREGLAVGLFRVRRQGWSQNAAIAEFKQGRFNPLLFGLSRYLRLEAGQPAQPTPAPATRGEAIVAQRPLQGDAPARSQSLRR
jgi:hypothetical protein